MRAKVCIPFYTEFETTKGGLLELSYCQEVDFDIHPRQGPTVSRLRNNLINDGKSQKMYQSSPEGYDYFLMIDSDIGFKLQDVLKLISHNKDICVAPYKKHESQGKYDCGMFYPEQPGRILGNAVTTETGFKKIDWCGAGFMLMKSTVFEKMEYPWYRHPIVRFRDNQEIASEDVGFCMNAKEHGLDIWCDFDIELEHKKRNVSNFNWELKKA